MRAFLFVVLLLAGSLRADDLILSQLDPTLDHVREKAFIPWSNPQVSGGYWEAMASKNVPIYNERRHGDMSRDLYIPNPGVGYWVLGGLTAESLRKVHQEKLKIGDELVSATAYTNEDGNTFYWALWVPKSRAHLVKKKMLEFGISPAEFRE